ncbi:hypothetical protein UCD39_12660 [Nitrospirillum sp. BR 11752]|uniref:hypothetical protein n=1 Tax=Nitrospirillum sp. BR 11752 TaxID=3104293 RepID=UPI002EB6EA2C|nr:hypothetical protein [Nitrospirillum sp. BR 11752]
MDGAVVTLTPPVTVGMIISPLKRHFTTIEPQPAAALTYTLKPHGEFINAFRQPRVVVGIIHAARGAQAGFKKTIALILDLSTPRRAANDRTWQNSNVFMPFGLYH